MNYLNFVKSNKYLLLFGFLCVFVGNLGQTFFISLFNKDLIGNLLLETDNLSLVYSVATLISGFTIFFVGAKIDDIEVKKFTTFVIIGLIASCVLFANSSNLVMLFFSYLGIRLLWAGPDDAYCGNNTDALYPAAPRQGGQSGAARHGVW